jgi:hypothetical protein
VSELLLTLYGECLANHRFSWSARPENYLDTPIGETLQRIRAALAQARGHADFIKSALVPPCDYYMPKQNFIVEFDESQHFSRPRHLALSFYPDALTLGFPLARWKELCRQIDARDDTPVDRDERRAWYDTLRDLVPAVYGFKPTVRLYAEELQWCSLDSASAPDMEFFQHSLRGRTAATFGAE